LAHAAYAKTAEDVKVAERSTGQIQDSWDDWGAVCFWWKRGFG
jgi:hypothetical protein